jgi:hypothetical protein
LLGSRFIKLNVPDIIHKSFNPWIRQCVAMVCKTCQQAIHDQAVMSSINTGSTQDTMGKDRVFFKVLQACVMKLVYWCTVLVLFGRLRPWTFTGLFNQHVTPALRASPDHDIRWHYPNHVAVLFTPLNTAGQVHQTTTFSISGHACFQCMPDFLPQALICRQCLQMSFRKTSTNKQAIDFGQMHVIERVKGYEFSACPFKSLQVVRVVKAESSITRDGNFYIGLGLSRRKF